MMEQQNNFDQIQTGQAVEIQPEQDNGKRKRRKTIVLILAILCVLLAVVVGLLFFRMYGKGDRVQAKLDLGNQYLDEMKYEEALAEFESILEIMPDNPDAYLGIVEVYIRQGEFDTALEYAQEGYEVTGDERLQEKVDMILSGNIFDSRGLQMKMSHYEGGVLKWWHQYTYNKAGDKASVTHCSADGRELGMVELEYDADGNQLVGYGYGDDGVLERVEKIYESGNYIKAVGYTLDGKPDWEMGYQYDGDKCVREIEYHYDSGWKWETIYQYEGDRLKKIIGIDGEGIECNYCLCEYNSQGLESKRTCYEIEDGKEKESTYWTWKYDQNGKEIERCCYRLDEERGEFLLYWKKIYEYDVNGKCIREKEYDGDGNLEWEETYD